MSLLSSQFKLIEFVDIKRPSEEMELDGEEFEAGASKRSNVFVWVEIIALTSNYLDGSGALSSVAMAPHVVLPSLTQSNCPQICSRFVPGAPTKRALLFRPHCDGRSKLPVVIDELGLKFFQLVKSSL